MNDPNNPLDQLWSEVRFLRQLVFLQDAQLRALREFVAAHIADLAGVERAVTSKAIRELVGKHYDAILMDLGDRYPNVADDIDVRKTLPRTPETDWLFPDQ